jgi:hypothetical protein
MKILITSIIYGVVGFTLGVSDIDYKDWRFYVILAAMVAVQIVEHFIE